MREMRERIVSSRGMACHARSGKGSLEFRVKW
jgi:hypothetical protein